MLSLSHGVVLSSERSTQRHTHAQPHLSDEADLAEANVTCKSTAHVYSDVSSFRTPKACSLAPAKMLAMAWRMVQSSAARLVLDPPAFFLPCSQASNDKVQTGSRRMQRHAGFTQSTLLEAPVDCDKRASALEESLKIPPLIALLLMNSSQ